MGHIHLRGKWRPRTPRWYNAALTHTKWMGNLSSPTLNSNCENRRACFCQTSPGMHVWGVIVPIRTVFMRSNWPRGYRTKAKPSLVFPTAMVVKVKDAKTTRKQIKCSAYDNTKKKPVRICVACNCFCSWRKVKAESEAERLVTTSYKISTVCWRRRKRQGKRNMIRTRDRTEGL